MQQLPRENSFKLPEYLERDEVNALIAAAPNPRARLIMLEQWRAGLRVSEALALEARDLHLDSDRPTPVVWLEEIVNTLDTHQVMLLHHPDHFYIVMMKGDRDGSVQCTPFKVDPMIKTA